MKILIIYLFLIEYSPIPVYLSGAHIRKWAEYTQTAKKGEKFLGEQAVIRQPSPRGSACHLIRGEYIAFKDPKFTCILKLFAKSPVPPHELHFSGLTSVSSTIEDPMLVTRHLAESFFSQILTILRFRKIENVPLPLFLICPKLREVFLDQVGTADKSYDDSQCSGREAPPLEVLEYRNSHSLVKQMIAPPPGFNTPAVLWSNLRVLTLAPHDKEGMACLQPILDAACNTLEELYLTGKHVGESRCGVSDNRKRI